jgi:hypothetical protein
VNDARLPSEGERVVEDCLPAGNDTVAWTSIGLAPL